MFVVAFIVVNILNSGIDRGGLLAFMVVYILDSGNDCESLLAITVVKILAFKQCSWDFLNVPSDKHLLIQLLFVNVPYHAPTSKIV